MCGITGAMTLWGNETIDRQTLDAMTAAIHHRGPDARALFMQDEMGFGFARLAIIDLKTGDQPIFNEDRSIVLICNGEIYNHHELRAELQSRGHVFQGRSDVEVILHLYEELGADLLSRLNGQFAFAIYDRNRKQMLLARDHVGIAPLFYSQQGGLFLFGSEIKAILAHPSVPRRVNLTTLDQVFTLPGPVSPATMFQGIHAVQPGHFLRVDAHGVTTHKYWDLEYPTQDRIDYSLTEEHVLDELDARLTQAVKYRLQADVPVGFYLSGGMDSSLIAAKIAQIQPERRHAFSIGFHQTSFDERPFQKLMAEQVKAIHHGRLFDWPDMDSRLREAIRVAEYPLKESYNTCSLALSELVAQQGLKVVLTGEGADELFAGYVGYRFDQDLRSEDAFDLEAMLEAEVRERLWGDPNLFYDRNYTAFSEIKQAVYSDNLLQEFPKFDCLQGSLVDHAALRGRHPLHKRSYLDSKLRLSDHLLADHGDRVSYANGVEARYPFLDINLIDFSRRIPPNLLVKDGVEKYILKRLAARYLPEPIVRREKFAFVAPGSAYLLQRKLDWIEHLLDPQTIRKQGYFNPDTVERLKQVYSEPGFQLNQTFETDLLLIVINFGLFLDLFQMPNLT